MSSNSSQMSIATAGTGLETARGRWIVIDTSGVATLQTDATATDTAGILLNNAVEGETVTLVHAGMCPRIVAGSIIDPWDFVASDSQGRVVKATGTDAVLGRYVPSVQAVDGVVSVLSGTQGYDVQVFPGRSFPTESPLARGNTVWVASIADFPDPVAGIITLPGDTSWMIIDHIDLGTNRLVCAGTATIAGRGPETTSIEATLGALEALVTSTDSFTLRNIALTATGATCVRVNGGGTAACDWLAVNFLDGRAAELTDVDNSINVLLSVFGDGFYVFGGINTLAFSETIFTPSTGEIGISIDSGPPPVVNRRLRLSNCAIVTSGTGVGLDVPVSSVANSEGFILDLVNFAGPTPANYVVGAAHTDLESRWIECRGITNTARIGSLYWEGNATVTTIAVTGTFVKAAGTSTISPLIQRFSMPVDNRLTYDSALVETFRISASASCSSNNNKIIAIIAMLNGVTPLAPAARSTSNAAGRAENITYQSIAQLGMTDYIEIWVANESDTVNITVEDLSVVILQA